MCKIRKLHRYFKKQILHMLSFEWCTSWTHTHKKAWDNHPENPNETTVRTLESRTENVKMYSVLQRNIIPAHAYAAEEGATSDPHDQIAPQNICETMNSGWAIGVKRTRGKHCSPSGTAWKNHPENLNEKMVRT